MQYQNQISPLHPEFPENPPQFHPGKPTIISVVRGNIRHRCTDFLHQSQILLLIIMPVHDLQDTAAARLHRQMQMMAHLPALTHIFDQVIRQILRMRCHKPDSLQPLDLLHLLRSCAKSPDPSKSFHKSLHSVPSITSVTPSATRASISFTIASGSASFTPSYIRHNAITAEIITSKHNIHTGLKE